MKDDPFAWILGGVGLAAASFLFMDFYDPMNGFLSNVMHEEIRGGQIKYPMTVAVGCVLYGAYLWSQKRSHKRN